MLTLQQAFHTAVGYSDHTEGIEIPIAAAALGATVIEKHFTLDKTMEGPDHQSSLEPKELKQMVRAIQHIQVALGNGIKTPSQSELKNKVIARKSIVASKEINVGDVFSEENLTIKRPATGINPMKWDSVIGKISSRTYNIDEPIVL
jgi:N,N'-diacetyllegionaminate synthase